MTTTKRDLQALHYLAQRLRADTHGAGPWHDNGLTAVLAKLEGHNLAITIERVTRHAADPEARTPGAIERPFVPEPAKPPARQPAKAGSPDECRRHKGEHATACRLCAVERYGHPEDPELDDDDREAGRLLQAKIRAARSGETTERNEP